jgi:hypothetical protein
MNTITTMAKTLGVERHVIVFLVNDRKIEKCGKVGNTNIYSRKDFGRIKKIIEEREAA